jgi:hypothetical protein
MENVDKKIDFFKFRRGYGAILGGTILVMIMLAGFGLYIINNQIQNEYHQTVGEVQSKDIDQFQEDLIFKNIKFPQGEISFEVINQGPKVVTVDYVGVFGTPSLDSEPYKTDRYVNFENQDYLSSDNTISIAPSDDPIPLTIDIPGIDPTQSDVYIHMVTDRGNVIPVTQSDTKFSAADSGKMALAEVIGYLLPNYDSFGWITRDLSDDYFMFSDFTESWKLPKNNYYLFKVEVEYVPAKDRVIIYKDLILDEITGIYFKDLENPIFVPFYIVYADETIDVDNGEVIDVTIGQLNVDGQVVIGPPDQDAEGNPVVDAFGNIIWKKANLYFAVRDEGDDPLFTKSVNLQKNSRLMVNLGIYEDFSRVPPVGLDYAQSFPLLAVYIIEP